MLTRSRFLKTQSAWLWGLWCWLSWLRIHESNSKIGHQTTNSSFKHQQQPQCTQYHYRKRFSGTQHLPISILCAACQFEYGFRNLQSIVNPAEERLHNCSLSNLQSINVSAACAFEHQDLLKASCSLIYIHDRHTSTFVLGSESWCIQYHMTAIFLAKRIMSLAIILLCLKRPLVLQMSLPGCSTCFKEQMLSSRQVIWQIRM